MPLRGQNLAKIRSPWNKDKTSVDTDRACGDPIDFVGREYQMTEFTSQSVIPGSEYASAVISRDALIDSIVDLDSSRNEIIKRLIIEESRLDILMRVLGYRSPDHQMMLNEFLSTRQFGLVLAPRGSGKSTSCDFCYCVMRALQNRNIRILIASRTMEQAKDFLSEVKSNFDKPALIELFGNLRGNKWDETRADIAGRTQHTKEHTFTIAGADGAVVSKHFDLIIGDDIVEDKNSRTELQRKQLKKFFYRSMLPCLRPDGEMRILGTRYHPEDLYGHLIENDPMFADNYFILPAVFDEDTGEAVDLLQDEYGKFYAPPNATCYDPVGYPMTSIIQKRSSMPLADFECQFQNRIEFMDGDFFKADWFKYYDQDPFVIAEKMELAIWIGVDLASSLKDEADEFAISVVGITRKSFDIYVLEQFSGKLTFNKQKQTLIHYYDRWNPVRTFVEANAYQAVLSSTTAEEFPDVRVMPVWTTKDKITRARALQLYYERGQVFHRKGRMSVLEGQLVGFPNVKLKDNFDALFIAINGALQGGARKRRAAEDEPGLF